MKTFLFVLAALATTSSALEMCSERAFQTAVQNVPKTKASLGCQRAVFFSLCGKCGREKGCYMSNAPKIAPTLPACQFPGRRRLRSVARCSEETFQRAVASVPNSGVALSCQRAVYNRLCDKCGDDVKCFWKFGPQVAPSLPQCQARRLTSYELEKEEEEHVGGFGRACAIAACLFIDNLNPPPPRYVPGSPGPAPIGRLYDEMDEEDVGGVGRCIAIAACLFINDLNPPPARYVPGSPGPAPIGRLYDEMDEEVGHYKLPHQHHDPAGWPGHDEMEEEVGQIRYYIHNNRI